MAKADIRAPRRAGFDPEPPFPVIFAVEHNSVLMYAVIRCGPRVEEGGT
jgi:hypothetical protein